MSIFAPPPLFPQPFNPRETKRILLFVSIIAAALVLTSCGATKRFKQTQEQSSSFENSAKYDSTGQTKAKTETSTDTKTKIKTTETIDTNITIPGSSVKGSKSIDDIKSGKPLVIDNNGHSLSIRFNPGTGNIEAQATTEAKSVPVRAERVTEAETNEQATRTAESQSKAKVSAKEAAKGDTSSASLNKASETAATPWYFAPWPWFILAGIIGILYLKYGSPLSWIAALVKRKQSGTHKRDDYSL
jgi:hypothetical protein